MSVVDDGSRWRKKEEEPHERLVVRSLRETIRLEEAEPIALPADWRHDARTSGFPDVWSARRRV